jgi:hypothetical protein
MLQDWRSAKPIGFWFDGLEFTRARGQDLKAECVTASVEEPVFADASRKVPLTELDGVFSNGTLTDDLHD